MFPARGAWDVPCTSQVDNEVSLGMFPARDAWDVPYTSPVDKGASIVLFPAHHKSIIISS